MNITSQDIQKAVQVDDLWILDSFVKQVDAEYEKRCATVELKDEACIELARLQSEARAAQELVKNTPVPVPTVQQIEAAENDRELLLRYIEDIRKARKRTQQDTNLEALERQAQIALRRLNDQRYEEMDRRGKLTIRLIMFTYAALVVTTIFSTGKIRIAGLALLTTLYGAGALFGLILTIYAFTCKSGRGIFSCGLWAIISIPALVIFTPLVALISSSLREEYQYQYGGENF